MKSRLLLLVVLLVSVLALAGCAPDANQAAQPGGQDVAGFWAGLWHGAVMLFTFIWSLFNDSVGIYEVNNNGGWYNFGYLLGAMMFLGGGGAAGNR